MNFYASLIFLGIILILLSMAWVIADKKKVFGAARDLDRKKQELVEIINDAEQMIEELNKFSDYIVTQMDLKNGELEANLKSAQENIKRLGEQAQSISMAEKQPEIRRYEETAKEDKSIAVSVAGTLSSTAAEILLHDASNPLMHLNRQPVKKSEKVIHINNKYSEVVRLAAEGFSELEIAKSLNMGKGEVALILGVNRNQTTDSRQVFDINEKSSISQTAII